MRIESFNHGILVFSITADDAAALGRCLRAASEAGAFDLAGQETEGLICESMATAFELAALASSAHGWVALNNHGDVADDLRMVGLGHLLTNSRDVLAQVADALRDTGD